MPTPTAFVKPQRLRAHVRRHPWVYGTSIERIEGEFEDGDAVVVRAPDGKFVAHAFANRRSRLFLRLVSFERDRPLSDELLAERVREAVALRHEVLRLPERGDAYRLIHSEGDGLPGLVVDRYGDVLVVNVSALGTHRRLGPILDALEAALRPRAIVETGGAEGPREQEGLPPPAGVLRGALLPAEQGDEAAPARVTIDGTSFRVPLLGGQKTGMFLDQRENARRVAALAPGRTVLDACCYVGTFALAAARAGASACLGFDSSEAAIELARQNAADNGVAERVELRRGSLYRELRALADAGRRFDLVVLDPPKFAHAARDVDRARKGYLEANTLALRLVPPGGLLFTFSCSHHVDEGLFEDVLREAASRAGASLRALERLAAGPDHPVDLHCPEGRYLKGLLLQRRS